MNDAFGIVHALVDDILEVAAAALVSGFSDFIHQVRQGKALLVLGKNPLNDSPQRRFVLHAVPNATNPADWEIGIEGILDLGIQFYEFLESVFALLEELLQFRSSLIQNAFEVCDAEWC